MYVGARISKCGGLRVLRTIVVVAPLSATSIAITTATPLQHATKQAVGEFYKATLMGGVRDRRH